jgi:hypothetical protein
MRDNNWQDGKIKHGKFIMYSHLLLLAFISFAAFGIEQPKCSYNRAQTDELKKLLDRSQGRLVPEHVQKALELIKGGADPNVYGTTGMSAGWTWLLLMVNCAQYDKVITLLELGADPNITRNNDKMSPLSMACINEPDSRIVQILIAKGAEVNARDKRGRCPLWECTNLTCAQLLLENGAAVGMIHADCFKQAATAMARLNNKDDVVALMELYRKQKIL